MATESFQSPRQSYFSPPMTIILTILLLVFFLMGFFSLFLCRCFVENVLQLWYLLHGRTNTPVGPACHNSGQGLDPSIIQSFPTFKYSAVKDLRKEEYGLECAICLGEFVDDDLLRLLRACFHVFHTECIDLWFESHTTCPVCRRVLDEIEKSPEKSPAPTNTVLINEIDSYARSEPIHEDASSITIKIEDMNDNSNNENYERGGPADKLKYPKKFRKSHSTGHSIGGGNIRNDGEDRFTLRLPQHLQAKLVRGHQWTGSCTIFGEFKSKECINGGVIGDVLEFCPGGDVNMV